MGDKNPWLVENIEAFNFYCCPECDFQSKDGDYFKRHAMESHKKSKVFFIMFENNINNDSVEVETYSESQVENKEGRVDFDPFETRSLSELELEEFVKFSEAKNQDCININGPDYISNRDLEIFNKNKTADNIEDDQEFEDNGENYENITDTETSDGETFDGIDKELECHNDHDVEITATFDNQPFAGSIDLEMETYNDNDVEKTKNFDGQIIDENVTKAVTKNYLTFEEKLKMRAILGKEDTEDEEDPIEIENQKIRDCLGDDHGSDPDFTAKSASDSDFSTSTDPDTDEERNQDEASIKKRKKIGKLMPCSKIRKTDKTHGRNGQSPMSLTPPTQVTNRNDTPKSSKVFLPLAKKLEIISLFEEGAKYSQIARDLGMPQSSVRTICDKKEKYRAQAAVANLSSKNATIFRTRTMEKMEKLLVLWILDFDQKGIPVFSSAIQTKAVSLFQHIKENLEDKTETEIKETFKGSPGWFDRFKKRHDLSCIQYHKCILCEKSFFTDLQLKTHLKRNHKEKTK